MNKRLPIHQRSEHIVRQLRPHPASFKRSIGVFRQRDGDIVFCVEAPDGDGTIYAAVPAEIACAIRSDLGDMLHCDDDNTPRPVVPLNEKLVTYYEAGYVQRQPDGGVLMNFAEPGGDLLVKLARRGATDLLSDLASALGYTLHPAARALPLEQKSP